MDKIKRWFLNLSLKQSFMWYMLLFILVATFLSTISISIFDNIHMEIIFKYVDDMESFDMATDQGVVVQPIY